MNQQTHTTLSLSLSVFVFVSTAVGCAQELDVDTAVSASVGVDDEKAIVGGASTTIDQHPWQVSLQSYGSHFCGGSIVAPTWVLTAQHCVEGETAAALTIVAGATQLSRPAEGQTRQVAEIVRYPGYSSPEFGKDVALLRLASPLTFNANVAPIALAATTDGVTDAGVTATVSGWGTLRSGGSAPDQLRSVSVPVVSDAAAQQAYGGTLTADQLAAGTGGRDSCQGDSGGPLSAMSSRGRVLIGVVSWGYGCGDARYPGIYARVTAFTSWIAEHTGISVVGEPGGSDAAVPATTTLLDRDIEGGRGSFLHHAIAVPAGAAQLEVVLSGDDGDADLYVRAGSRPTANSWHCRPYTSTSNEICTLNNPAAGTWYVSVAGYTAYTGAHLTAVVR